MKKVRTKTVTGGRRSPAGSGAAPHDFAFVTFVFIRLFDSRLTHALSCLPFVFYFLLFSFVLSVLLFCLFFCFVCSFAFGALFKKAFFSRFLRKKRCAPPWLPDRFAFLAKRSGKHGPENKPSKVAFRRVQFALSRYPKTVTTQGT
ncbi:hypothetical protein [Candidatus Magnetaquiglobus chichijimensis]|uniref:hypothetical protein n=1 Tax=Candidatus Magnetaquiglobus chichijimensis TaxID=3141448 RepID=UPI003B9704EE